MAAASHQSTLSNHHLHSMARHSFENGQNNDNEQQQQHNQQQHQQQQQQQQQQRQLSHYQHHQNSNISNGSIVETNSFYNAFYGHHHHHHHPPLSPSSQHQINQHAAIAAAAAIHHTEIDIDPRELELFAERFKQRRIKLGVTQADVGQQLSKLKLPGVGSLSQSNFFLKIILNKNIFSISLILLFINVFILKSKLAIAWDKIFFLNRQILSVTTDILESNNFSRLPNFYRY